MLDRQVCRDAMWHYPDVDDWSHAYAMRFESILLQLDTAYETFFAFLFAERVKQNQTLKKINMKSHIIRR